MSSSCAAAQSPQQPHRPFYQVYGELQEESEGVLLQPSNERTTQFADRLFSYLQNNLDQFNGADTSINKLIDRLDPYRSPHLRIEPLLKKIIQDVRTENSRLKETTSKKVVHFSSSAAAELTTEFLRKEKNHFSLFETLEMCCLLVAQNMEAKATLLFNFHTIKHFIENPQQFTEQLLEYEQEARESLYPTAPQIHVSIIRKLLQSSLIESAGLDLLSRTPPQLFNWLQNGERGAKELFQGLEQFIHQDYNKAFELYKQAAALGSSQALIEIGDCYWNGQGVPTQDYNRAFEFYKQAADLGSSQALIEMGNCYWHGKGVPTQDYNKAFELYKQAADLGNLKALIHLGHCYFTGNSDPDQDYNKAFELYKQAADLGSSHALIHMGRCYFTGKGVPTRDYNRAFELYKQAADLGSSQALIHMGRCYWDGKGADQSFEKAFDCFLQAKKQGDERGALFVTKCLTWGKGTQKNLVEAKEILQVLIARNVSGAYEFYHRNFNN